MDNFLIAPLDIAINEIDEYTSKGKKVIWTKENGHIEFFNFSNEERNAVLSYMTSRAKKKGLNLVFACGL